MNPPIKRLLAFAGSVAAGLLGTIVLAGPAQAHHPMISGTSVCQADGKYKVTWTVQNGNWPNPYMKITEVTPTPSNNAVSNITVGTWLDPDKSVTGVQYVPGNARTATLKIVANWYLTKTSTQVMVDDWRQETVSLDGTCVAEPDPTVKFDDLCDGTTNVHLVNPTSTMKTFRIKGAADNSSVTVELDKGETDKVIPASAGALTVEVKNGNGTWIELGKHQAWARPADCPAPTVLSWSTCDSFKIAVTNAEKGLPVETKVTYGTQTPITKTIAPGKTENFEFSPSSTTTAKVELTGWDTQTITYVKPTNCDELPRTGAATTTYIASGTGLAMLGGLAFFFARRRMVKLRKLASM